jgi:hypothetical protein
VFFALHLDSFIVTRNFSAIYRDYRRLDNFIVTHSLLPSTGPDSYRDGKNHATATQTAPNQIAGPLAHTSENVRLSLLRRFNKALS